MPTKLRAQRDRERRERTREALLDAAESVFASTGFHATKVSEIVAEAGVGQGTFYRNFESKREAFVTLFDRLVETLIGEFDGMSVRLPATVADYRDASLGAIRRMAATLAEHRHLVLLFLREGPSIDRDFEARLDGVYERFAGLAQFYLDHAIARGIARRCDSALVSQALVGMGLRLLQRWLRNEPADEAATEGSLRELVDFAFLGFGKNGLPPHEARAEEAAGR